MVTVNAVKWVVKTSIEIPGPIFRKAKSRAAERGQSLKEFVTEALTAKLAGHIGTSRPTEPPWMQGFGELRHLRSETARIQAAIDREFGVVEPEDRICLSTPTRFPPSLKADAAAGELLRQPSRVCIPVIVLGEYRYGIAGSRHRAIYEQWLDLRIPHFDVLQVTENTAVTYAEIRIILKQQGTPFPANDVWIAALARQHRLPGLSRDRHFDGIPGVNRQAW